MGKVHISFYIHVFSLRTICIVYIYKHSKYCQYSVKSDLIICKLNEDSTITLIVLKRDCIHTLWEKKLDVINCIQWKCIVNSLINVIIHKQPFENVNITT